MVAWPSLIRFDEISHASEALQCLIGVQRRESYVGRIIRSRVDNSDNSGEPEQVFVHDPNDIAPREIVNVSRKAISDDEPIAINGKGRRRCSVRPAMECILTSR